MAKTKKSVSHEPLEKKLWKAADKLRKNIDAAEYKHIVLGLIFLKYISDAFDEVYERLSSPEMKAEGADAEDKNEYTAEKVFYVPPSARWKWIQGRAKLPTVGKDVDDAMEEIEKDNPSLRGVLPKVFAQERLDKTSLGGLIDLVSGASLGTKEARSKDVLGRVYEYFLGEFALAEGKKGGQFYTPSSVVRLLVAMLEPYEGRVFDPCCGSGGMFVQSEKFIEAHSDHYKNGNGKKIAINPKDRISIYGQESNQTTCRLAKMNLAIRGIDSTNVRWNNEGSFLNDAHRDLKADFLIANPPFNDSDWSGELLREDARWKVTGKNLPPPVNNANFAWIQHFLFHLAPDGLAGFLLAVNSLESDSTIENEIRKEIIEKDLVDCVVTLPGKLFYSTPIPVAIWILARNKTDNRFRSRSGETLFIDAGKLGTAIDRTHSDLSSTAISHISSTYNNWRSIHGEYEDRPGFCSSVSLDRIRDLGYSLFPPRHVGIDDELEQDFLALTHNAIEQSVETYSHAKDDLLKSFARFDEVQTSPQSPILYIPKEHITVPLSEVLTISNERLGDEPEPEILTCTETAGLVLQRERFAKRVATENTSSYKIVRRTDIVYNPYLLWAGSIDQCTVVDVGITSPAYEVFTINPGFDPTLIGSLVRSETMIKLYNGISVGTIERRRRAPAERFLSLNVTIPSIKEQQRFTSLVTDLNREIEQVSSLRKAIKDLISASGRLWLNSHRID